MKLSELASVAEIIGAFAVVISLIYVGVQVNDRADAVQFASAKDANIVCENVSNDGHCDSQSGLGA